MTTEMRRRTAQIVWPLLLLLPLVTFGGRASGEIGPLSASSVADTSTFNVKDPKYGAVSDAATDNAPAFQAAIAAVPGVCEGNLAGTPAMGSSCTQDSDCGSNARCMFNGTIYVPPGWYKFASPIGTITKHGLKLQCANPLSTVLWFPVQTATPFITLGRNDDGSNPKETLLDVTIEGCYISGRLNSPITDAAIVAGSAGQPDVLVKAINTRGLVFRNDVFARAAQNLVQLYRNSAGGNDVSFVTLFDHCEFHNAGTGVSPAVTFPDGCGLSAMSSKGQTYLTMVSPYFQSNETACLCGPISGEIFGGYCGGVQGANALWGFDFEIGASTTVNFAPIGVYSVQFENDKGTALLHLRQTYGATIIGNNISTSNAALQATNAILIDGTTNNRTAGIALHGNVLGANNSPTGFVGIRIAGSPGTIANVDYRGNYFDAPGAGAGGWDTSSRVRVQTSNVSTGVIPAGTTAPTTCAAGEVSKVYYDSDKDEFCHCVNTDGAGLFKWCPEESGSTCGTSTDCG